MQYHGYYILRKSCILKPRIRGSFRDLKFPRKSWKSEEANASGFQTIQKFMFLLMFSVLLVNEAIWHDVRLLRKRNSLLPHRARSWTKHFNMHRVCSWQNVFGTHFSPLVLSRGTPNRELLTFPWFYWKLQVSKTTTNSRFPNTRFSQNVVPMGTTFWGNLVFWNLEFMVVFETWSFQ